MQSEKASGSQGTRPDGNLSVVTKTLHLEWFKVCILLDYPLILQPSFGFHGLFNVLTMIFSGSQNCFYCCCLFVTDNPEPCVDRYTGIRKYGAQRLSDQLEMNELSTKYPNPKVHHSADICCILTMYHALTCIERHYGEWHGWEASAGLCKLWPGSCIRQDHLGHLYTCGFQSPTSCIWISGAQTREAAWLISPGGGDLLHSIAVILNSKESC